MGALRVVGGVLALAGAALILVEVIIVIMNVGFVADEIMLLLLPIIALIGGILGIANKRAGGVLAMIVGIVWVIGAILFYMLIPFSLYLIAAPGWLSVTLGFTIWSFVTIEVVLVLVGGILTIAGGE